MDWTKATPLPLHIGTTSRLSVCNRMRVFGTGGGGSNTWMTANEAAFIPVRIPFVYPVKRVYWMNGSVGAGSGHVDFGIYTPSGQRIYSTGSTLMSGASVVQYVTPTTPFILVPGEYFFAYANDGTTNRAGGASVATAGMARCMGIFVQLTALPLPATATFAQAPTTTIIPFCGVSRTPSGFA